MATDTVEQTAIYEIAQLPDTIIQEREMMAEFAANIEYNRIIAAIQEDVNAGKFTAEYARSMSIAEIRKRYGGFSNAIHQI